MALLWTVLSAIVAVLSFVFILITKWFDPHAESFGYPFDTKKRIDDLLDAVEELKEIRDDMFLLNPQPSWEQGRGWFRSVCHAVTNAHHIKELHDEDHSLSRKFSIARKSDIEARRIKNLITEGRSLFVAAQANPLPVHIMSLLPQQFLIGMDSVIKRLFEFLGESDNQANGILGLHGPCGTGKSSLLKMVCDSCSQVAVFDFVIFVVATHECTVLKLQKAILASVGLGIPVVNEEYNAAVIFNMLKDKSFLLLLDDLWARVDLVKVGVPLPLISTHQFRRKLIFTTRSLVVCADMETRHNYISLGYLDASNSWTLFEDKAGKTTIYSHPHIPDLAAEIVSACSGLPIALCAVGRLMSVVTDPKDWLVVVQCLKNSGITEILGFDHYMSLRLQLSYHRLEDVVKDCFLVCSLFEKGANISRERLISWWFGFGLLEVNDYSKGHLIINTLLAVGLLERGDNNHNYSEDLCIKMHPIIHDIFFRRVREYKKQWVPLSYLSSISSWQNLSNLTFLDFSHNDHINEVPKAIRYLVNLRYLDISGTDVVSLPFELFYLSELKFLYLRNMKHLRHIPCWVITRLNKLEVLDFFFDMSVKGNCNSFVETPGLGYTSTLLLELEKYNVQLQVFGICVHTTTQLKILSNLPKACITSLCVDSLALEANGQIANDGQIYLHNLSQIENLRELSITRCKTIKEIVAEGEQTHSKLGLFSELEYLVLSHVEKVTWRNTGFNLRVVTLFDCAITHASWLIHLHCLVEIKVTECQMMEKLVDTTSLSPDLFKDQAFVCFPELKRLTLQLLPKLSAISDINCETRKLSYLQVHVCHQLKSLCLQPHANQTKITIWCTQEWWDKLEWFSDIMKAYLMPFCNMKGTDLLKSKP